MTQQSDRYADLTPPFTWVALGMALALFMGASVAAADEWRVHPWTKAGDATTLFAETRKLASNGLPDGLIAENSEHKDILSAWYSAPTTRYGHSILGDGIEAGALVVKLGTGETRTLKLPDSAVFEDRYPRLADLDGDGTTEVITIRSSLSHGAAVTVYGLDGDVLIEKATTEFIGRSNRWLNIAGIARFSGTSGKEIAFVRTPHIGGTLFLYAYSNGQLRQTASLHGFSNHQIGSREMRLSAVVDIEGNGKMELALPSDDRSVLHIVGLADGKLLEVGSARLPGRIDKAIQVRGTGSDTRFVVGLDNSGIYEITR